MMNFFVTSDTSATGNLGGLTGADARCQRLAGAVGAGGKTWHAYLSAMNPATNAKDRIGEGPYYNSAGVMLAATKAALHMRDGDANLFLTEQGQKVSGQWTGSPDGVQHDILGPGMSNAPPYNSWNSSHTGMCSNTTPGGGRGRIYCFVAP
jgi:hypothetical protein